MFSWKREMNMEKNLEKQNMKNQLFDEIDRQRERLWQMADTIFDHPECDGGEVQAAEILCQYLTKNGFTVERPVAGLKTAFRAEYRSDYIDVRTVESTMPRIGILCEYDALKGLGHGCGHHMQGPACLGAAVALKNCCGEIPFSLVVYGTPAEETFGGKINMMEAGYFKDIDLALMMHGAPSTCTDIHCLALSSFEVTFHGKKAHAAIMPEAGRSAFDALLLAFQGMEFMREHVREDVRMHYTVKELPGPENVVPSKAVGSFALRSFSREYLDTVTERFYDLIKGAALMAGVTYEILEKPALANKIPNQILNDLLMENVGLAGAPGIAPPRERTGSTDFGNVMHELPGSCIRVQFVPEGTSSHSQAYVDAGKTQAAHDCVIYGAKAIAGAAWDIIGTDGLLETIKEEFLRKKEMYK